MAKVYFAAGYNTFILRYSVLEKAKDFGPLIQLACAMAHVRKNADAWGVDADRVAVCVFSAGGHLAGSLSRGMNIDEAVKEMNGVTLESIVVAERVVRAVKVAAERGILDTKDFPLLMHVDEIICQKKLANMPWEAFTFTYEK